MRRRYKQNERLGELVDEVVFYDPVTGEVHEPATPNPIPMSAFAERGKTKVDNDPVSAAYQSGLGRIDWGRVQRVPLKQIESFEKLHGIGALLSENAKTSKPRKATGRTGKIAGMNLSPHYYPNLLNVIDVDAKTGTIEFIETATFQAFTGDTVLDALKTCNGDGAKEKLSKLNVLTFCAGSSRACRATCLVGTGQHAGGDTHGFAKMRATYALLSDPETFVAALNRQLASFACECRADGKDAVVRLNMLSDIPWYEVCPELLLEHENAIYWYDYTKVPFWRSDAYNSLWRTDARGDRYNLLDLTYSFSGDNEPECREALRNGYRVAAVFASENPERKGIAGWQRTSFREIQQSGLVNARNEIRLFGGDWTLIDGDESDYRIDDPAPCVVALNFKASGTLVSPSQTDEEWLRSQSAEWRRKSDSQKREALERKHLFDLARARMHAPVGRKGETRFELSKKQFSVTVPKTPKGRAYAEALGRKYWDADDEDTRVLPPDVSVGDLSVDQVLEIESAYERASRKGGAKAGIPAARAAAEALGIGTFGPGTNRLPDNVPPLAMQRIGGTDLLIGPTVPTTAND